MRPHDSHEKWLDVDTLDCYCVKVESSNAVTPTIKIICLRFEEGQDFNFEAGQFISVIVDRARRQVIKAYSIASPRHDKGSIELLIKRVEGGYVSNYMHNLEVGQELEIWGPSGMFVLDRPFQNDLIFVATGAGLSSIMSMLSVVLCEEAPFRVWLIHGVRTKEELVKRNFWEEWAAHNYNFRYIPTLTRADDTWIGERGRVQNALVKYIGDARDPDIYICGLWKMVEDVVKIAKEMGLQDEKIHYEDFV